MEQTLLIKEIAQNLRDVKHDVLELVKQTAVANQVISEHEKRASELELRLKPIEEVYVAVVRVSALLIGSGAVISTVVALVALFHRSSFSP